MEISKELAALFETTDFKKTFGSKQSFVKKIPGLDSLFNIKDIDSVLKLNRLDSNAFLLFKNGRKLAPELISDEVPPGKTECFLNYEKTISAICDDGYSLKVYDIDNYSEKLSSLKTFFVDHFKMIITLNLYLTPRTEYCFDEHQDNYDIFILQLEGEKKWHLNLDSSFSSLTADELKPAINQATIFNLAQGELAYLPTSAVHKASNEMSTPSMHLTIGVHPITFGDVFKFVISDKTSNLFMRQPLPYDAEGIKMDEVVKRCLSYTKLCLSEKSIESIVEQITNKRKSTPVHMRQSRSLLDSLGKIKTSQNSAKEASV